MRSKRSRWRLQVRSSRNAQSFCDRRPKSRSGLALMVMLVALGIVSAICVNLLKISVTERHQARRETLAVQANWLAESGMELAVALLKQDAQRRGTTWKIPAEQLDGRHTAVVSVEVVPVENQPQRRQLTVTAEYPANSGQPIRPRLVRFVDL